ncbi:MAG: CoA pyrophosphatase [Oceanospirillaceae bacterium]|nr:CoA pyrophosphatase [Oceanospirillaceae bacterium]
MLSAIKRRLFNYQRREIHENFPQAGVLIAITDERCPKVVLTKRASRLSSHSGEIAFPGGKRDKTDTDITFTALREAHEEISLPPSQVSVLTNLDDKISLHRLKVTPCVGVIAADVDLIASPSELDCVFKVPLSFFLDEANRIDHLSEYRAKARYAPCYLYEGHLIWGLTSYILMEFLNIALLADIELQVRAH